MTPLSLPDLPPKAASVDTKGNPDGWAAPRGFRPQVAPDGSTRLVVNVPSAELPALHLALLDALSPPVSVRYVQLTDRRGAGALPKPRSFVAMDVAPARVREELCARPTLVWFDGRHQLWLRGRFGEQVVLDELGVLYLYPDDPSFRDVLGSLPEDSRVGLDGRDYVRVELHAAADPEEQALIDSLGLREWSGPG